MQQFVKMMKKIKHVWLPIRGVRTKRQKSPKGLKVEFLKNDKCYIIYGLLHLHLKWLTSTTTLKTCQTTLTSNLSLYYCARNFLSSTKFQEKSWILVHFKTIQEFPEWY